MNRKQKIIISVTGIFIVLLILVGLTYAYFLTNIRGNTNTKSIEVSTANLILEYGENTNVIQGINNAVPGYSVSKYFTATNNGNASVDYVATLDSVVNELTRQGDLEYTLTCASYLKTGFNLAANGTPTGTIDGTCNGVDATQFPSTSSINIMVGNRISTTQVHYYVLTINYKEMGVDQSDDMDKAFSALVNIKDIKTIPNPYQSNTSLLSYNIINNALTGANGEVGSKFVAAPLTKPAEESTMKYVKGPDPSTYTNTRTNAENFFITYANDYSIDENTGYFTLINPSTTTLYSDIADKTTLLGKYVVNVSTTSSSAQATNNLSSIYQISKTSSEVTASSFKYTNLSKEYQSTEKVLSTTQDDYGDSYYYRGGVEDNYINFAGMCWRIVRIEGDGSIKLILDDSTHECNSGSYTGNWTIGNNVLYGYDGSRRADFLNYSGGLADALKTYQGSLSTKISSAHTGKTITDYLKVDEWCYDDNVISVMEDGYEYYGAYDRIDIDKKPSLKCSGTKLTKFEDNTNMYVSTLTADETVFAGTNSMPSDNFSYYLFNNYTENNIVFWWTLSLGEFVPNYPGGGIDFAYYINPYGALSTFEVNSDSIVRIAVTLKSNVEISTGNGIQDNPYVLK